MDHEWGVLAGFRISLVQARKILKGEIESHPLLLSRSTLAFVGPPGCLVCGELYEAVSDQPCRGRATSGDDIAHG
jgi:hypothetical protein